MEWLLRGKTLTAAATTSWQDLLVNIKAPQLLPANQRWRNLHGRASWQPRPAQLSTLMILALVVVMVVERKNLSKLHHLVKLNHQHRPQIVAGTTNTSQSISVEYEAMGEHWIQMTTVTEILSINMKILVDNRLPSAPSDLIIVSITYFWWERAWLMLLAQYLTLWFQEIIKQTASTLQQRITQNFYFLLLTHISTQSPGSIQIFYSQIFYFRDPPAVEPPQKFSDDQQQTTSTVPVTKSFKMLRLKKGDTEELGIIISKKRSVNKGGTTGYIIAHIEPDGLINK